MSINANKHTEYRDRHNLIWIELKETHRNHGVHNYSIF